MNPNPLVTIVIPAYNAERYLPDCLRSVQAQKYTNLEILIIDDGSSDSTGQICRDFAEGDSRIVILRQKNSGVSSARNNGIRNASGAYIQFLDADDVLEPDAISRLVDCMTRTSADAVSFGYREFDDANEKSVMREPVAISGECKLLNRHSALQCMHYGQISNSVWALIFNRDFLMKHNLRFDTSIPYGEDILFIYQAASVADHFALLPDQLYLYRKNTGGATHKHSIEFAQSDLEVISRLDGIQRGGRDLDSVNYVILRLRLLLDAYSILPYRKQTRAERKLAREVRTEIRRCGSIRCFRRLDAKHAIKLVLIALGIYDFVAIAYQSFR
ncbi:glycosyltransferase family 2 protein [Pseudoscardovia suis]|uniref:glycosyltransferase family 2 protein n=1 Tax=Pseudoscardovia suis TaxID=987063 RepID=UPI003F98214C